MKTTNDNLFAIRILLSLLLYVLVSQKYTVNHSHISSIIAGSALYKERRKSDFKGIERNGDNQE